MIILIRIYKFVNYFIKMNYYIPIIPIKIIMLGQLNVGKTSLLKKYCKNNQEILFYKNLSHISTLKIKNGVRFEITLSDTAGQEKYKSLSSIYFKGVKIVILVYSIDNEKSFKELDNWLKLVKTNIDSNLIIFGVIANKSDLASETTISNERGINYAKKIGGYFKSTCAINEDNDFEEFIDELFNKYYENKLDIEAESNSTLNRGMIRYSTVGRNSCC